MDTMHFAGPAGSISVEPVDGGWIVASWLHTPDGVGASRRSVVSDPVALEEMVWALHDANLERLNTAAVAHVAPPPQIVAAEVQTSMLPEVAEHPMVEPLALRRRRPKMSDHGGKPGCTAGLPRLSQVGIEFVRTQEVGAVVTVAAIGEAIKATGRSVTSGSPVAGWLVSLGLLARVGPGKLIVLSHTPSVTA